MVSLILQVVQFGCVKAMHFNQTNHNMIGEGEVVEGAGEEDLEVVEVVLVLVAVEHVYGTQ